MEACAEWAGDTHQYLMLEEVIQQTVYSDELQYPAGLQFTTEAEDGKEGNHRLGHEKPEMAVPTVEADALMEEQKVYDIQDKKQCADGDAPLLGGNQPQELIGMAFGYHAESELEVGEERHIAIPRIVARRDEQVDSQVDYREGIHRPLLHTYYHIIEQCQQFRHHDARDEPHLSALQDVAEELSCEKEVLVGDMLHGVRQYPVEEIGAQDGGEDVHRLLLVIELAVLHLQEEIATGEEEAAQEERAIKCREPTGRAAMAQDDEEHEYALRRVEEGDSTPLIVSLSY